eukprot:14044896-Alexandrium_andersonii.AAC.1
MCPCREARPVGVIRLGSVRITSKNFAMRSTALRKKVPRSPKRFVCFAQRAWASGSKCRVSAAFALSRGLLLPLSIFK